MPRCPPDKIVTDDRLGLRICTETGEVLEENIISEEADWRAYTSEEKIERPRTSGVVSPMLTNMGVGAQFGAFTGRKSALNRIRGFRGEPLDKIGRRVLRREEREALKLIYDISRRLNLADNIRDEAAHFYRRMLEKGLVRGRSVLACVIVSFYIACRISKIPCKIEDFIRALTSYELGSGKIEMLRKEVVGVFKNITRSMGLKFPIIGPEVYIEKLAGKLGIPEYVVVDAINMLTEARRRGYRLKGSPTGIAAGLLYLAVRKHELKEITQDRIAEAAGITNVTVRNRVKELSKYVN